MKTNPSPGVALYRRVRRFLHLLNTCGRGNHDFYGYNADELNGRPASLMKCRRCGEIVQHERDGSACVATAVLWIGMLALAALMAWVNH